MTLRIAAAMLATIFAAACASGAAPSSSAPAATQAAATTAATTAPTAAAASPAATANPDTALIDLIRGGKAAYRVTYEMKTTGGGQSTTATYTQSYKPPFFRVDIVGATPAENVTSLVRPEGTYVCGAFTGAPSCFSFGGGAAAGGNLPAPPQPIPTDLTGWGIARASARTIAGQSTSCFSFTTPTGQGGAGFETVGCYTVQGIPLFMSSKSAGTEVSMTATQFTTSVTDADFAVPFPVQKLPGQP
jgi:hypothetical protein